MPRQPRFLVPGQPHHVIQRGNNRSPIFAGEADCRVFRDGFAEACRGHGCLVHAYVLMTNHVHFLMTPASAGGIGYVMQTIGRRYVPYFNRMHERTGGLWEGRYRARRIDSERYLLTCYRYIELNPVRAGLVTDPSQYRWSSYGANATGLLDPLVTAHERYLALGVSREARTTAYRALFNQLLDERALFGIRHGRKEESGKGLTLGSDPFRVPWAQ
jgi:putative transposase